MLKTLLQRFPGNQYDGLEGNAPARDHADPSAVLYRPVVRGVPRRADSNSRVRPNFDVCGGSAFLWQSNRGKFLVLAHHVWAAFRDRILQRPGRHLIFYLDGDHAIPIFGYSPVSVDQDLDLAVLAGPGIENLKLDEKAFFPQPPYARSEVSTGDRLASVAIQKTCVLLKSPTTLLELYTCRGLQLWERLG